MTPTQRIFAVTAALAVFLVILDLVRRRKIGIQYSVVWLVTGAVIVALSIWYEGLVALTRLIGAVLPTTTLFIFGILFLTVMALHLTLRVTRQQQTIVQLAQEVALLRHEMERRRAEPGGNAGTTG